MMFIEHLCAISFSHLHWLQTISSPFTIPLQKKALQALKAPRQEPEPIHPVKRPSEAKDAKEYAKKLIRSGAIRSIERRDDNKEKTTFKRSKVQLPEQ